MKTLRIVFICGILCLLYNYPIIEICQQKSVHKSLLAYAIYIFSLWALIIVIFYKALARYFNPDQP
jgi:hypothetical protein